MKKIFTFTLLALCTTFVYAQYITTLAGNGSPGFVDAAGTNARFTYPSAVALDGSGNIYVADGYNHSIRKITPTGVVSTLAGDGTAGYKDDNIGTNAQFNSPYGLTVDATGNVYVADTYNHRIRKIDPSGKVTTVAGSGIWGILDGTLMGSRFYMPSSVAIDNATGILYVTDYAGHDVRKVDIAGDAVSLLAGNPGLGNGQYADGTGTAARFYHPTCIVLHGGDLYVADEDNHCIRKVTTAGVVTTIAGIGQNSGSADGPLGTNKFNYPRAIAFDASGNMMVAGYIGGNIRQMDPSTGNVSTFAGTGAQNYFDAVYLSAEFHFPGGIAVNTSTGTIYIADVYNHAIRQTAPQPMPVSFGELRAQVQNGVLQVNWTSLTENNSASYDIEASTDGLGFRKIGSVLSKAKDGNSSTPQDYNFSTPLKTAMQGIALLFGFLAFGYRKRSRLLALGFVTLGLGLFALSCQKNVEEATGTVSQQLFIRIKQIDKNGAVNYSKITPVIKN